MGLFGVLGGLLGGGGLGGGGGLLGSSNYMAQNAAVQQASNDLMTEQSQDQLQALQQNTQLTRVQSNYNNQQRVATTVATMAEQEESLTLSIQGSINSLTKTATDMVKGQ